MNNEYIQINNIRLRFRRNSFPMQISIADNGPFVLVLIDAGQGER